MLLLAWSLTKTLLLIVLGKDHHSEDVAAEPSGSPGQAAVRLQQLLLLAWSLTKTFPTHSHPILCSAGQVQAALILASATFYEDQDPTEPEELLQKSSASIMIYSE